MTLKVGFHLDQRMLLTAIASKLMLVRLAEVGSPMSDGSSTTVSKHDR
ncbi:MAG: hypothetical protein ACI841_001820 [Planctomycetota bacterium]